MHVEVTEAVRQPSSAGDAGSGGARVAFALRRGTSLAAHRRMENHKQPSRDTRRTDDADPGIETDPLPHHAHEEADGGDEIEEAQLASDDLVALDEDDLFYAEGPDA